MLAPQATPGDLGTNRHNRPQSSSMTRTASPPKGRSLRTTDSGRLVGRMQSAARSMPYTRWLIWGAHAGREEVVAQHVPVGGQRRAVSGEFGVQLAVGEVTRRAGQPRCCGEPVLKARLVKTRVEPSAQESLLTRFSCNTARSLPAAPLPDDPRPSARSPEPVPKTPSPRKRTTRAGEAFSLGVCREHADVRAGQSAADGTRRCRRHCRVRGPCYALAMRRRDRAGVQVCSTYASARRM